MTLLVCFIFGCSQAVNLNTEPPTAAKKPVGIVAPELPIVFQPKFTWQNGEVSHQGTGFLCKGKDDEVYGVTSAHFINFDGPALLEANWLEYTTLDPWVTFNKCVGEPGDAGTTEPEIDLSRDYLVLSGINQNSKSTL